MEAPSNITPFDWHRIFIGDVSWLFTLEILFRTSLIYLYSLMLIRYVSRRTVGQLSLIEFLIVVALGSAVGDPMFYPDVPLLHAFLVITMVVLWSHYITMMINKFERVETTIEGKPVCLVENAVINLDGLREARLSQEKLFEMLRCHGVEHLGQVRVAYLEQGGAVTLFRAEPPRLGLPIVPPWDLRPPEEWHPDIQNKSTLLACMNCGWVFKGNGVIPCPNCSETAMTNALPHLPST